MRAFQNGFGFFAGNAFAAQIDQHHMAFGAAADDAQAALGQGLCHHFGVFQHLLLVGFELWLQRFFKCNRFSGDDMHQRAALQAREDGAVDGFLVLSLHQNNAAAWAAQAFVRGAGYDVSVRHRIRVDARSNQARVMRHVDHEDRANIFGHFGKAFKINAQAVSRGTSDDEFRLAFVRFAFHRVVVDGFVGVQAVAHHIEPFARHIQRHAVGQVAAFGQAHAHDGLAGFDESQQHRLVG